MDFFQTIDEDIFCEIYNRLHVQLLLYVENKVYSRTEAEDILANTFYKVYRHSFKLKSFDHVRRKLYVAARNEIIDSFRRKKKNRAVIRDLAFLSDNMERNDGRGFEQEKTAILQIVEEEVRKLPRQRRIVLDLYFKEGKTTPEIAERLGLSDQTVLNHKTNALESLRKTFVGVTALRI
jgi:RNA polymerase sigma factor (sigma-70 family)